MLLTSDAYDFMLLTSDVYHSMLRIILYIKRQFQLIDTHIIDVFHRALLTGVLMHSELGTQPPFSSAHSSMSLM